LPRIEQGDTEADFEEPHMKTKNRAVTPGPAQPAGQLPRRDVLKAVALLAATPLAGQASIATQSPASRPAAAVAGRRDQPFDEGWRFLRGDAPGAESPSFNDTAWRTLDLPHDFSVEDLPPRAADANGEGTLWGTAVLPTRVGPFDTELSAGGRDTGWFVGGTGWYRKRFSAAAVPADRRVEIVFDGVYMNSDAWLNGTLLGTHPYGYTPFAYDLTPHLQRTNENVLAVRVRNDGRNSRWYSGSGIYRHVWLNTTGSVRVPLWGLFVTTPEVSKDRASVKVAIRVENRSQSERDVTVRIRLVDPRSSVVGTHEMKQPLAAGSGADVEHVFTVASPQLWSPATPQLYRAEVELLPGGTVSDRVASPFGIRKVEVDAARGLRVNSESIKLRGGCLHHDNGLLGACAIDRAEERRVELMKAHGFNAIRTSHNPPSPAFLDACDRLGMLVIDEAFDQWERQKNAQDYHLYFADWWQRDLSTMVQRDRNHPSVIIWSIGNEIPERAQPRGVEIAKQLTDHIKALDPTRPITAAINGFGGGEALDPAFEHLDIAGYNYLFTLYDPDHARRPNRVIVGLESLPQQAFPSWLPAEKQPYVIGDFVWTGMDYLGESSIGNAQLNTPGGRGGAGGGAPGGAGALAGAGGRAVGAAAAAPGAAGAPPAAGPGGTGAPAGAGGRAGGGQAPSGLAALFAGSSISLPFPWFNSYCGDIDLIGQPKPQWFHRRVIWGLSTLEMAVQRPVPDGRTEAISPWGWSDELRSWTWPGSEGRTVKVHVYTVGDEVRLLLNGKEIGTKPVSAATELKAEFDVPYAAGELKAIALSSGRQIAELAFKTVGKPARLRLTADRATIRRDRNDLSYVTLEVLDQAGELVPDAVVPVRIAVSGAAELAAAGTANPKDVWSFRQPRLRTFHGRGLAIVRPVGVAGPASVRAQADGLVSASLAVLVK
jgi:beta-galactosidase